MRAIAEATLPQCLIASYAPAMCITNCSLPSIILTPIINFANRYVAVVLWSDLLGSVQWREDTISWGQSNECGGTAGARRKTNAAKQYRLYRENVKTAF